MADRCPRRCAPLVLALLVAAAPARAQDGEPAAARARDLLSAGQPGLAIALLKQAIAQKPLDESLRLWLARAYLDDDNSFWALRTVTAAAALHPEDCNLTLWQARIQLAQGALEPARQLLVAPCDRWPPVAARRALLLAMVEQGLGANAKAQAFLDEARAARFAFPEDRVAMARLASALDPGRLPPIAGRLDLAVGGTSNARAGSPVDPASQGKGARSVAVQVASSVRFVTPDRAWARLSLEGEVHGIGYPAEAGRDYSYLLFGGRPGLLVDVLGRRALLGYRYETLLLAGGDKQVEGPLWFFDAHRGEWELELWPQLTLFGGVGRRGFRESGRTRTEVDGGVGTGFPLGARLHVMGALSGRYHDAVNDAYDERGLSLLLSAELRAPSRWSARAGVLASADDYPRSAGYFEPKAPTQARRDVVVRFSLSAFTPPSRQQVKLGLTYELAVRDSTAAPYDYVDHRLLAKLIWTFTGDPWLPHAATPIGHVPIDYGLASVELAERVQDLLRQGEATQRSSSCRD